jgi:chromosome segregation ATPase
MTTQTTTPAEYVAVTDALEAHVEYLRLYGQSGTDRRMDAADALFVALSAAGQCEYRAARDFAWERSTTVGTLASALAETVAQRRAAARARRVETMTKMLTAEELAVAVLDAQQERDNARAELAALRELLDAERAVLARTREEWVAARRAAERAREELAAEKERADRLGDLLSNQETRSNELGDELRRTRSAIQAALTA